MINLVQHDEARVAAFRDNSTHGRRADIPLENQKSCFTVLVGIGNPPTYYNLLVDTGSAVTWVGANKAYEKTASSFVTPWEVVIPTIIYRILFTDVLTFDDTFTTEMKIAVASDYDEGMIYNGVLGIGPTGLSAGSVKNHPEIELETITQRLFDTGSISQPLVGIFFQPSSRDGNDGGILNFGEPNTAFYTDDIAYTPVTTIFPASMFWGFEQRITYGTTEILLTGFGIVDCGSTYNYLASNAYENYRVETGANFDSRTNFLSITPERYDALLPLEFHIGGINGLDGGVYLAVKNLNTPVGRGDDFRLGYVFLQRFYAVFDIAGSRVGFSKTPFTDATTN
ncbi:aspartic peptidase domain-containing protein [Suillus spraguei]|nr:aspartic peptidase domain-containing protein [Suillus spraguei]